MYSAEQMNRLSLGKTTDVKYSSKLTNAWRYALRNYHPIEYGINTFELTEKDPYSGQYQFKQSLRPKVFCLSDDIFRWVTGYNDDVYSRTYQCAVENGVEAYIDKILAGMTLEEAVGDPLAYHTMYPGY